MMHGPRPSVLRLFDPLCAPETPRRGNSQTLLAESPDKENTTPKPAGELTTFFRRTFKSKASQQGTFQVSSGRSDALVDIAHSSSNIRKLDGVQEDENEQQECGQDAVTLADNDRDGCHDTDDTITIPPIVKNGAFSTGSTSDSLNPSVSTSLHLPTAPSITVTVGDESHNLLSPSVSLSTTTAYLQPSPLCTMIGTTPCPLTPSEASASPAPALQSTGSTGTLNVNTLLQDKGRVYDVSFDILNDDMSFLSGIADMSQDISPVVPLPVTAPITSALHISKKESHRSEIVLDQLSAAEYEERLIIQKAKEAKEMAKERLPEIRPLNLKKAKGTKKHVRILETEDALEDDDETVKILPRKEVETRNAVPVFAPPSHPGTLANAVASSSSAQALTISQPSSELPDTNQQLAPVQSIIRVNSLSGKTASKPPVSKSRFKGIQRPSPGDRVALPTSVVGDMGLQRPFIGSQMSSRDVVGPNTTSGVQVDTLNSRTKSGPQRPSRPAIISSNMSNANTLPEARQFRMMDAQRSASNTSSTTNPKLGLGHRAPSSTTTNGFGLTRTWSSSSSVSTASTTSNETGKSVSTRSAIPRPATSRLPAPSTRR